MNKHIVTSFVAVAAACFAGSTAYAGPVSKPSKKVIEPAQESCITGDIGFDIVSNYITKGVMQQNQGFIIQPYADLHFRIYKGAGALTSVTADIGIWNSFHGNRPNIGGTTRNWYEFDFQAGLTANFDKLALGGYFKTYESPADQFNTCYAIGISLAYDDSAALGNFALHPYAFAELNVQGTTGNNNNGSRGQYYEVGIAPGHTWGAVTLSLPIKGGFGSGGLYLGNRGFGFISVGPRVDYALNAIPACLGKWSLSASATYVYLNGQNGENGGPRSGAAGAGGGQTVIDNNQVVFQGGLKVAF